MYQRSSHNSRRIYREGKITLSEAAVLTNKRLREMIDLLLAHGVKGNIRLDQQRKALDFITSQST